MLLPAAAAAADAGPTAVVGANLSAAVQAYDAGGNSALLASEMYANAYHPPYRINSLANQKTGLLTLRATYVSSLPGDLDLPYRPPNLFRTMHPTIQGRCAIEIEFQTSGVYSISLEFKARRPCVSPPHAGRAPAALPHPQIPPASSLKP